MDEILIDRFMTDPILVGLCKELMPDHIKDGSVYPAVAYQLEGEVIRCAKGTGNFNHDLMFLVEAKSKREVIEVKNAIITRFNNWNYLSLLGYADSFERTSKTYLGILNFKITKTRTS